MKLTKLSLLALGLGFCLPAKAQFIINYDLFYQSSYVFQADTFKTRCITPLRKAGNATVSTLAGWPWSFMFTTVNNAGGVSLEKQYFLPSAPAGNMTWGADAVIECEDDGFLIAGYAVNGDDYGVSAVKLDPSGTAMWSKFYVIGSSASGRTYPIGGFTILKVQPRPNAHEEYVFVCTGESPAMTSGDSEPFAMKIDNSGTQIWARRYIDANRSTLPITNVTHRTYGAVYVPKTNEIVISGQRNETATSGSNSRFFIFSIDFVSGHPVQRYRSYKVSGDPVEGRSIMDDNDIVVAFTNSNTSAFGGLATSTIGLMKFDYNLNLVAERQYIKNFAGIGANFISGITYSVTNESGAPGDGFAYVISGKAKEATGGQWQPFIYKVNNATLAPFIARSMSGVSESVDHTQTINPYSGDEEYNILSNVNLPANGQDYIQITKFSQVLDYCNKQNMVIADNAMNPQERYKTDYLGVSSINEYDLNITDMDDNVNDTGCRNEIRRIANTGGLSTTGLSRYEGALQLYPNTLKAHEAGNIMIAAPGATAGSPVQLRMLDGNGRVVLQKEISLNGTTAISCPLPALAPGLYILRVTGASGALLGTFKLSAF